MCYVCGVIPPTWEMICRWLAWLALIQWFGSWRAGVICPVLVQTCQTATRWWVSVEDIYSFVLWGDPV